MKRRAIRSDVVLHTVLVGVRGLETRDEKLREIIYNGVKRANACDMQTTDGGGDAGGTSRHHVEVIQADETLAGHIYGQPVGGEEVSAKNGVCDIRYVKLLREGMTFAE